MSKRLVVETPYASPDSLRAFLQTSKQFYELHTARNIGYTDMDDLQYTGTVENFGAELLLETRKQRMNRPPSGMLTISEGLEQYFDIMPSDFINTYDQQNMLMAVVKPNAMVPYRTYQIHFSRCDEVRVLRSEASGDFPVRISTFIKTRSAPILYVDEYDAINGTTRRLEVPLFAGENTTYYFAINAMTESLISEKAGSTILTVDIKEHVGLPFIWFCADEMQMLPPLKTRNNVDRKGHPLLVPGTNGQDTTFLYPYAYGENNLPDVKGIEEEAWWYIKAYGDFHPAGNNVESNYNVAIKKIEFVLAKNAVYNKDVIATHTIILDANQNDARVTLCRYGNQSWGFRTPVPGDYDYDGVTYKNVTCAHMPLMRFNDALKGDNPEMIPAFQVRFADKYYHMYESEINHMTAGIHVDYTTDYSDNSVDKKFGVIHDLGDFDGLPKYFKYFLDRTIHRPHVEMYAIRDDANVRNQKAMDKQTAAIILDAGVPQNDLKEIAADMESVIHYDHDRVYTSDEDKIVSTVNFLSDVVYVDGNHLADCHCNDCADNPRFVYHGGRTFSLSIIEFDPEMEMGRGYLITNDPASYENNETMRQQKAPRTMARICDIPTSFSQLVNIKGVSPTLVVDPKYIRQGASYNEADFRRLWNDLQTRWYYTFKTVPRRYGRSYITAIFVHDPTVFTDGPNGDHIETVYRETVFPDQYLNMMDTSSYTITLIDPGNSYGINDTFGFNIGGVYLRGEVTELTDDGTQGILSYTIKLDDRIVGMTDDGISTNLDVKIPLANFESQETVYALETISGNGKDARLKISIDSSIWKTKQRTTDGIIDGLFALVYDDTIDGIYIVPYNNDTDTWDFDKKVQLSGDIDVGNVHYDDSETRSQRSLRSVYLYNLLNCRNVEEADLLYYAERKSIEMNNIAYEFNPPKLSIEVISSTSDISKHISDAGLNVWNSFLAAVPMRDKQQYRIMQWYYDMYQSYQYLDMGNGNYIFPKRSGLNLNTYDGMLSTLKFVPYKGRNVIFMYDPIRNAGDSYVYTQACIRHTTGNPFTIQDLVPISDGAYPDDIDPLYVGDILQYNLYRFNPMARAKELIELEEAFQYNSAFDIYMLIVNKFGKSNLSTEIFNRSEKTYNSGYEYKTGEYVIDTTSTIVYYVTETFISINVQEDVSAGYLKPIGPSTRKQELIDYYIMNDHPDSVYDRADVELFLEKGKSLSADVPADTPIGGFVPVADVLNEHVTVSSNVRSVEPLFVLRIDEEIPDLDSFRMYDGDMDISNYTLLIMGGKEYTFHNNRWEWNYH